LKLLGGCIREEQIYQLKGNRCDDIDIKPALQIVFPYCFQICFHFSSIIDYGSDKVNDYIHEEKEVNAPVKNSPVNIIHLDSQPDL